MRPVYPIPFGSKWESGHTVHCFHANNIHYRGVLGRDDPRPVNFGKWFAWGEFDPAWAFPFLEAILRGPGLGAANTFVVERLDRLFPDWPHECLNALNLFLETNTDRWFFVGTRKKEGVWKLLEKALRHGDENIRSQARDLVNVIGSQGHLEFRELLN